MPKKHKIFIIIVASVEVVFWSCFLCLNVSFYCAATFIMVSGRSKNMSTRLFFGQFLNTPSDAPEHILSDLTWGPQVFWVFQHQTPLPRQPRCSWSDDGVCSGGICVSPCTFSPDSEPSWDFLSCLCDVFDGYASCSSHDAQYTKNSVDWPTNPLQPASMGMCLTLEPCSQQNSMYAHFLHLKLNLCHRALDCSSLLITVIPSAPLELLHSNEQTPPIWNCVHIYGLTTWLESKGGIFTESKTVTKPLHDVESRIVPGYRSEAEIMEQFYGAPLKKDEKHSVFGVVSVLEWK